MRILLICSDSPLDRSYGAGLRTHNIWNALSRFGTVSALVIVPAERTAIDTTPRPGEIGRIGFSRRPVPWETLDSRRIKHLVAQLAGPIGYDLVVARYLRLGLLIQGSIAAPTIVDGDDLEKVAPAIGKSILRKQIDALNTTARRIVTRRALGNFAHVWFVNPRDMIKYPTPSGSVLCNITEAPVELPVHVSVQPPCLLMVGKFGYEPNAEAAEFFIRNVLPVLRRVVPGVRFRLVGQCPIDVAQRWRLAEGVEVAGFVDDLTVEYARSSVVVAPVFSGGGTQIKVLEALGYGCGTLVSAFSAVGFAPYLRDGEHLLVAHDTQQWVEKCLELIDSPSLCGRLGAAGRQVVLQRYSLDGMTQEIGATIARLGLPIP